MKHRKKSNTSLIFELLIKHYTKNLLEGKEDKSKEIFKLVVKYFNPSSVLTEELSLCNMLLKTQINSFETGSRLLSEVKNAASYLDEQSIKDMKFNLLLEVYETIGKDFFALPLRNYKKHASVYQLVNDYKGNVKINNVADRITLEEQVISNLIDGNFYLSNVKINKMNTREKLAERLSYNIYNEKYNDYFSNEEKDIIKQYVTNSNFKEFAIAKFSEIKQLLNETKNIKDEKVINKLQEAVKNIDAILENNDKHELAYNLLLYQELTNELNNIGDKNE